MNIIRLHASFLAVAGCGSPTVRQVSEPCELQHLALQKQSPCLTSIAKVMKNRTCRSACFDLLRAPSPAIYVQCSDGQQSNRIASRANQILVKVPWDYEEPIPSKDCSIQIRLVPLGYPSVLSRIPSTSDHDPSLDFVSY
jgi:hypothetical protein